MMFGVSSTIKYYFMFKSHKNTSSKHALSHHAGKITRQANLPPTHARARPSFHPAWLPDFYSDRFGRAATGGTVGKSRNLGEETASSCLCSNSIFILRIASRGITKVIPVSIKKSLERDRMSGCIKENKLFLKLGKNNRNMIWERSRVIFLFSQVGKNPNVYLI